MLGDWARIGRTQQEAVQFKQAFHMSNILLERYCASMAKQNTLMRNAIPAAKRLAIFLDWAGSGSPHQYLAANMTFAKLHFASLFMTPFSFCAKSVPSMIVFPGGDDLLRYCDS